MSSTTTVQFYFQIEQPKRKRAWRMPKWMKQYKDNILKYGTIRHIETLMNYDFSDAYENPVKGINSVSVRQRVNLLIQLKNKRMLVNDNT